MRRRKKLWIVCAALAVVVALCAFTLLYRPVPYRFLEGSRYVKTVIFSDMASRRYIVRGTVNSVTARALEELTPQDGWKSDSVSDGPVLISKPRSRVSVFIGAKLGGPAFFPPGEPWIRNQPGTVSVIVTEPTTLFDRFLVWLESR